MDELVHTRQLGIIDPAKLTHRIAIIGAGSIGGWTALCLGKLGCSNITVFDHDSVEVHNAGSQIYKAADEGEKKVAALEERLRFLLENPIETHDIKWSPKESLLEYDIIIAAVDNITNRREIYEHIKHRNKLYIDARMASNGIEIYTTRTSVPEDCERYEETLFDEKDNREIPCSERSVVYNVFVVAGMIGDLVAKWANAEELPREVVIDLKNLTLYK
jgi:molybdopterin/thiamine biosynthesis adenylyltransferase